ncbi:putative bacterial ABC-type protein transporter [Helianthus annuus]|uniref:Peptide-transporting ATPase n=1 Tax=Helianthus annuus TaxID=4232 RepID=A0A9K3I6I4_HELAN|nr:putative peptide-transporting ATPase [Helianthus annuus]KAJ0534200.1 putative bacterial ABC-type protein transporter [Helianthus annuus]KAJ0888098.1 putative bacterial ABC-type protein transporter [Helianthus annuus]KAJ0892994.1 putative ABC-type protein transporter [Helianthus annuus]
MSISQLKFGHQNLNSNSIHPVNLRFQSSHIKFKLATTRLHSSTSASLTQPLVPEDKIRATKHNLSPNINRLFDFLPGRSWWDLGEEDEADMVKTDNPVTVWYVLQRIWRLVADDKLVIYIGLCSLTVAAVSEICIPNLLAASVFAAQNGESLVLYKNLKILTFLCFASGICSGLRSGCFGIANMVLLKRLRKTLYTNILLQDVSFFDREPVGNLTSRLGADCQKLSHIISNNLHLIVRNTLQGTGALINLLTLSWPLALSSCFICILLCMIFLVYGWYQKKAAKLIQDSTAHANEVSQEALSLVRTIRVKGTETKEHERYKRWLDKLAFVSTRESVALLAIILGGMSILAGHASAEQLTKYVLYCEWLIYAAWRLADNFSSLLQCVGASEKVFQLIDVLPSHQFSAKGVKLQKLRAQFEFINVSFHYPSRTKTPALDQVNISIQPNEVLAVVGLSGSGKSTLVHLLLGLYEPTQGQILIDGHPLKDLDMRWLRENIGYVGQEPHLFRMDIKSNISYGCSRKLKQEDVERAAKQARAHEFICSLPDAYETLVDDELLSGGQKQRIAIARAIVRDPVILILDEPTSALDAETEYYIQELMMRLKNEEKAILFIAHRLSTARAADRIVVMDQGRVAEMGDHETLLSQNGLYARLHRLQNNNCL